jgi:hypothetical protein
VSTLDALDSAIRDHFRDVDNDSGPVVAWVLIAALDNNGDTDDITWIDSPDGQRTFVTTGLIHEAANICAAAAARPEDD